MPATTLPRPEVLPQPRGVSILEMIISLAIFSMMFLMVFMLLGATRSMTRLGETQEDLSYYYGRRALQRIASDMRMCGRVPVPRTGAGKLYPRFANMSSTPSVSNAGLLYLAQGNAVCGVPSGYLGSGLFAHPGVPVAKHVSAKARLSGSQPGGVVYPAGHLY